jgi:transcriptional regulator with AAA-type ATPase domain
MPLFDTATRRFAQAISNLAHCNPFLPARIEWEKASLGGEFDESAARWTVVASEEWGATLEDDANRAAILKRCEPLLAGVRAKLAKHADCSEADRALYEDLVLFVIYHEHRAAMDRVIIDGMAGKTSGASKLIASMQARAKHFCCLDNVVVPLWKQVPHMTATFFQIRRAFYNIFNFIVGDSQPAMRLRAAVWESIFTHDLRRYRRVLYDRMADYTTLITGPSGTGKELVARAVGLSRYIPLDPKTGQFAEEFAGTFYPLNLTALSPTLIESELFGHKRGAFTGAIEDRAGWLEVCPGQGAVFLDEIGELAPTLQVKLLRVIQERSFSRLGETRQRAFRGKLIAATNRDLAERMQSGEFREDLYYRLCSDIIATPTLRERLVDNPAELSDLVMHIARRMVGDDAETVAAEALAVIEQQLGPSYPWPGNIRELEQCVRNVLIRKHYRPSTQASPPAASARQRVLAAIEAGTLTADELLHAYCTLVYAETGSYEAAARRIGLDRRTVRAKTDAKLLAELRRS